MSGLWTSCLHLNCIVFSYVAKTASGDTNLLSFLSVFLSIHTEVCSVLIAYSVSPVGDMNWKLKLPGRISQVVETGQVDWVQENQGMMRSVENWGALFSLKGFKFELKQTNKQRHWASHIKLVCRLSSAQAPKFMSFGLNFGRIG